MVFSSLLFIFAFLPVFLLLYFLTPGRYKNYTALLGSYFFYAWGAPRFVLVFFATTVIDYVASRWFGSRNKHRKTILIITLIINIGLLAYYKYSNFFVSDLNQLAAIFRLPTIAWAKVVLPIGISFITFHKISYLVDVYRGTVKPAEKFSHYALYLALFPHSIAGPIIRYHSLADQLKLRTHSWERLYNGIIRFCFGLGKKVLIANALGEVADKAFQIDFASLATPVAWLGILAYAMQIYFDFSGYSDMAIGLAKMIGFDFQENFNHPYIAQTFMEFWRRWHISLSGWMKEYLYIPLGGNRVSAGRRYFNLWFVFLVSGFWHGANWTFLMWGMYHGIFLVFDKIFWLKISRKLPKFFNISLTFVFLLFSWVIFRSADLASAFLYFIKLFGLDGIHAPQIIWPDIISNRALVMLAIALLISFVPAFLKEKAETDLDKKLGWASLAKYGAGLALFVLSVMALTNSQFNPFIYFRF